MEPEAKVSQLVEHLFREESGRMIAVLTGDFGLRHLELIEDAVQEALLKALRSWSYGSVPPNPSAWLMVVARNFALDNLRRDSRWREKEKQLTESAGQSFDPERVFLESEIKDDQLRMIFACCHPVLGPEAQVALTLKVLCGFSVEEMGRAFLLRPDTIAKRLTRARERLRTEAVPFEIPADAALSPRLDSALDVLYLLFNEGYNASQGADLIRHDLCREAIRLTSALQEHPAGDKPRTHALLALFYLQAARFAARTDPAGEILLLQEQDRAAWDRGMIAHGMQQLARARAGDEISRFHLQAGIAACHCAASSYNATDWRTILRLYDIFLEIDDSPVIALNRAVALAKVQGVPAGLEAVEAIKDRDELQRYYLFHAVRGELCLAAGRREEAAQHWQRALGLTNIPAEKNFLRRKLENLTGPG